MKPGAPAFSLLAAGVALILVSCATVPDQTYLKRGALANVRKVVVVASTEDVRVTGDKGVLFTVLGVPFAPAGLVGIAVDWSIAGTVDAHRSAAVRAVSPKETIAQRLSGHFTRSVSASSVFDTIEQASPGDASVRSPEALRNFDAMLRLKVTELSVRPVTQNEWSLFVELSAEMVPLSEGREGTLLWSRRERLASNEPHELEFYKSQGLPMLDAALASLAKRLADDLIYSK